MEVLYFVCGARRSQLMRDLLGGTGARKPSSMKLFDSRALYAALNERRLAQGLSWQELARLIGVSLSTLTRTRSGGRLEVDGMLAMVAWLERSAEEFVRDRSK